MLLERPAAAELQDLLTDQPGTADEDLLDQALEAVRGANGGLSTEEQRRIAEGEAIAVQIETADIEAVDVLITENTERHPKRLRGMARAMAAKLRAARKKAKSNGRRS